MEQELINLINAIREQNAHFEALAAKLDAMTAALKQFSGCTTTTIQAPEGFSLVRG
jgi:hypothetical protein